MDKNIEDLFYDLWRTIISYLPNLLAGVLLIIIGWVIGWFIKRIVIQLLVILRFDKLLGRFKWKNALSKADVRYAIYHLIGNVFFVIVFLIFLDAALSAMKLLVLSKLIENSVLIIPKIMLALTIFGFGWLIASRSSTAIAHALIKENIPHSSLIARFAKFLFITFFFAVALIELEIATTIVVIAFTTIFVSIGTISIILVAGNKNMLKDFFNSGK